MSGLFNMKTLPEIDLARYRYELPQSRIALYPLAKRDQSKLLHYHKGQINHLAFSNITSLIEPGSTLFFNNTKVIPARMIFHKDTGAQIEIFLLKPVSPSYILSLVMEEKHSVSWECMIGNFKKWRGSQKLTRELTGEAGNCTLEVQVEDRNICTFFCRNRRNGRAYAPAPLPQSRSRTR